eukprot:6686410-Pyramimonas_sp.AAC.1
MGIKAAQAKQEAHHQEIWSAIQRIKQQLSLGEAEAPILDMTKLPDWDREPDPAIFVLPSAQPVGAAAVRTSIAEWLDAAEVAPPQFQIYGEGPTRRFVLQLLGGRPVAIAKSVAFVRALQLPGRGGCGQFTVQTPTNSAINK